MCKHLFFCFFVGFMAHSLTAAPLAMAREAESYTYNPLRVTIRPRVRKDPETLQQKAAKSVEKYITTHQWGETLDNNYFSGYEDENLITNFSSEASPDRFHGLNVKLLHYGDKKFGLEKAELRGHRLYNQVSRNMIVPMYALQAGDGSNNPSFTNYSRIGQNWLLMNMKTIGAYAEKGSRRNVVMMLNLAPKHFYNNMSLKKSVRIMVERTHSKSTIQSMSAPNNLRP